jgi:hypothetical protein
MPSLQLYQKKRGDRDIFCVPSLGNNFVGRYPSLKGNEIVHAKFYLGEDG